MNNIEESQEKPCGREPWDGDTALLSQIVRECQGGIFTYVLPERHVLQINREAIRLFGWEDGRVAPGARLFDRVDGEMVREDQSALRALLRGLREPGDTLTTSYRLQRDGIVYLKVQMQSKLVERAGGGRMVISMLVDVTEKYLHEKEQLARFMNMQVRYAKTERDNRREMRRYTDVIRALSADYFAIYIIDVLHNRIQTVRAQDKLLPQVGETIGNEARCDQVLSAYANRYVHPEDRERLISEISLGMLYRRLKREKVFFIRYRRISGELCEYTEFKVVDISDNQNTSRCVLAVRSVDSEVRKEIEQQELLKEALIQAQYANKAKTTFLSNMSHDIRTPMNAIVGFASIAMTHLEDRERVRDCITKINAASKHLQNLINDVLDMSRIESGKLVLREAPCRISELVSDLAAVFQPQTQAGGLTFRVETDVRDDRVYADTLKLNQVLINILGNAVKFTPAGGSIFFSARQQALPAEGCGKYVFTVRDTGIGMSKEFQRHIFEPFERETTSTLSQTEGTGLGMTISKNLMELMGGEITLESEQGRGTAFTVSLVLRQQAPGEGADEDRGDEPGQVSFEGVRVLLVEDNELNREIAVELLENEGFVVDQAVDGADAIQKLESSEPDCYRVVLMDIQMPVLNGYEATRQIRAMGRRDLATIPIIAMTANAFEEDRELAMKSGMNDHLAKPVRVDELLDKLGKILQ